ncbi:winged helix DNA-binding domain-containing protein [Phytomonospora sp. NPDC050363]|uniref:winged helix DNA-binding domain-containing protein n=1 Tax=Phytomonospora sp. NPDC050363 TaxID=3155642 RepID=UPI0033E0C5A6
MTMTTTTLSRRELNRATLARQHLLARTRMTARDMVGHLIGLQAQAPHASYFGLWSRIEDFAFDDLSALMTGREVVRIALMRSTIHLVTAEDALGVRPLIQAALSRDLFNNGTYRKGVENIDLDEVLAVGRALMEESPRTGAQLRDAFAERWPERDAPSLAYAVRCLLPSVQVPPRGVWNRSGAIAHTTAEHWLGRDLSAESTLDELVPRYLNAFGPASVKDMQKWSGLTKLREVFDRLRPGLRVFRDEHGAELFDLPDAPRPGAGTEAPARLVAPFDNVLLSHADRTRVITEAQLKHAMTQNGILRGSLFADGFFVGCWDLVRTKKSATVVLAPLEAVTAAQTAELEAEAARLLQATDPGLVHEIRVAPED